MRAFCRAASHTKAIRAKIEWMRSLAFLFASVVGRRESQNRKNGNAEIDFFVLFSMGCCVRSYFCAASICASAGSTGWLRKVASIVKPKLDGSTSEFHVAHSRHVKDLAWDTIKIDRYHNPTRLAVETSPRSILISNDDPWPILSDREGHVRLLVQAGEHKQDVMTCK